MHVPVSKALFFFPGHEYFVGAHLAALLDDGEGAALFQGLARSNVETRLASQRVVDELLQRGVVARDGGSVVLVRADQAIEYIDRAVAEREKDRSGRGETRDQQNVD